MFLCVVIALTTLFVHTPTKDLELKVHLAQTKLEKKTGLQKKYFLKDNEGMLFIFKKEGFYPFWMQDTPLALALLFINQKCQIVDIQFGMPYSKETIQGKLPYQYVLELKRSFVEKKSIKIGQKVSGERLDIP